MYIGIGTVVLIVIIVLVILMLRRRLYRCRRTQEDGRPQGDKTRQDQGPGESRIH